MTKNIYSFGFTTIVNGINTFYQTIAYIWIKYIVKCIFQICSFCCDFSPQKCVENN